MTNRSVRIALLIYCLFFLVDLHAQTEGITVSTEGGPSLVSLRGNEFFEDNHRADVGFVNGIGLKYSFTNRVSVKTSVLFERKGSATEITYTDINGSLLAEGLFRVRFDYIVAPLLVQYAFGAERKLFVNAGPYVGYLLQQKFVRTKVDDFPRDTQDNTENIEPLDVGFTLGFGTAIPLTEHLVASGELRHNLGLTNTSKLPVIDDGSIKTNSTNVLFGVGYTF